LLLSLGDLERETSLELATSTLARLSRHRATPHDTMIIHGVSRCCGLCGSEAQPRFGCG
jgi:hypothetical protein